MLTHRLIVCLDVDRGRVVKGTTFRQLRDVGDPAMLAQRYEAAGADEIVFLDVTASPDGRDTLLDDVRRTAETLYIPLTVGGGIRSVHDAAITLRAGADKVSINSAAVARPALIAECAARFGSQCIVASIDARSVSREPRAESRKWHLVTHGGRHGTSIDVVQWARQCEALGAGEILLTSIDRDGVRGGYDIALTRAVATAVRIPVIASGGAGAPAHISQVLTSTNASAALVAGIVHDGAVTIPEIKRDMATRGLSVRICA